MTNYTPPNLIERLRCRPVISFVPLGLGPHVHPFAASSATCSLLYTYTYTPKFGQRAWRSWARKVREQVARLMGGNLHPDLQTRIHLDT